MLRWQSGTKLARRAGELQLGFSGKGRWVMCLTRVLPSLLQGTLIQHLKEHMLHGNMTSSDILLYYTTVCPAASCCPSIWGSGVHGRRVSSLPAAWLRAAWGAAANPELELGVGVFLSSLERFQKDLAVFLGWHTYTGSCSFFQCLGLSPGPRAR